MPRNTRVPDDRASGASAGAAQSDQPNIFYRTAPTWPGAPLVDGERRAEFSDHGGVQKALQIAAVVVAALLLFGIIAWNQLLAGMPTLPHNKELWSLNRERAVQFVDMTGKTVAVRGNLYGPVVRGAELPVHVGQAFIAAEDQRFMQHGGIDLRAISRAVMANLKAGSTVQGGSTLTQQLVKNLLVGNDETLRRKAQEAWLAMEMESALTKQEILDLYLNRVYLGANAYGVEAAAQTYFGKPAKKLTLAEAAFLAALPKAPTRYAADKTGPATSARVRYVLDRMTAIGFVTAERAEEARSQELTFVDAPSEQAISGHVLDAAMNEARAVLSELPPDAVIALTVDASLQAKAEAAMNATLDVKRLGANEGAIVVMDRDGPIRALVGGRDYAKSQFNRATQARRQPGSAFKTFVYAAALEQGFTPTTIRDDAPVKLGKWEPRNYEDEYRGPITLARAVAVSSNAVAAQLGSEIGPRRIVDLAQRFGIESELHPYPSIALGTDEVTLLEMTSAYGVLANAGLRVKPYIVSEIRDQRDAVLYRAPASDGKRVYDAAAASMMTAMLANVVNAGTGVQAKVPGWQIAGKTGTSQAWRDAWFVGYSARLVGGVWIGNDDDRATRKTTGGSAAAALFAKVMTAAHRRLEPEPLRGGDLGAAWLGPEPEDPLAEEWFGFPELGPLTGQIDALPPPDELSETPGIAGPPSREDGPEREPELPSPASPMETRPAPIPEPEIVDDLPTPMLPPPAQHSLDTQAP